MPVLVLGAGEAGRRVVASLRAQPELGLKPVAFLDDDEQKDSRVKECQSPVRSRWRRIWAGGCASATLLVAMPGLKREELLRVLERMGAAFSHVIVIPDLFGMASLWVSARDLGGVLGLEVRQNLLSPVNRWLKRGLDLLLARWRWSRGAAGARRGGDLDQAESAPVRRSSSRSAEAKETARIRVRKLRTMYP